MIPIKWLEKRIKKNETLINVTGNNRPFYGFWDLHKGKHVLRLLGAIKDKETKELIHAQEVLRYYPDGHRQRIIYKTYNGTIFNEIVKAKVWATENLREPYGMRFVYKTDFQENSDYIMNFKLTKKGKDYKKYYTWRKDRRKEKWGYYNKEYETKIKLWFKDITEFILTEKEYEKTKNLKHNFKTNLNIFSILNKEKEKHFNLKEVVNYLNLYQEFSGLKIIWKERMQKHLKKTFLEKLKNYNDLFGKNEINKWYIKQLKTNTKLAEVLNSRNIRKAFFGVDIIEEKRKATFKTKLSKACKTKFETKIYDQKKKKFIIQEQSQEEITIRSVTKQYLTELPIYKKGTFFDYSEYEIIHFIDYLLFKLSNNEKLTKAMILNKDWELELDLMKEEKNKKESMELELKVIEIADMLGIHKSQLKEAEEKHKYLFKLPKTIEEINNQGKELKHCYQNNSSYLKNHANTSRVLIFIEKDGKPFATATLHNDGRVTQVLTYQNQKTEEKLERKFSKIIKTQFLPKLQEMRGENNGNKEQNYAA